MTAEAQSPTTTSDERVMAALAHFFGLIAALIIWVVNKDKSRFVRFQALQALALDALWTLVTFGLMFCFMGLLIAGSVLGVATAANNPDLPAEALPLLAGFAWPWLMFICMLPFGLVYMILRLAACISVLSGKDFRYPVIGRQVEIFLKNG